MPIKHGMTRVAGRHSPRTPTYLSWQRMKSRCTNPNDRDFPRYNRRGITLCERWHSFSNFLEDMGERPAQTVLDRIDNNGNYEPSNCRWVSVQESCNNRSSNRLITIQGVTRSITEWCEVTGLGLTFMSRIHRGWEPERAAAEPKHAQFKRRPNGNR